MRDTRLIARIVVLGVAVVVVAVLAALLLGVGKTKYKVHAYFQNASQLVKGDNVQVAGVPIGSVTSLRLTPDGQADLTLTITNADYKPLRVGTTATVRQASLSGIANRYIDLQLPPGSAAAIKNGGSIFQDHTNSAVDLDQLFNVFDTSTRKALSGVIRGFSTLYGGRGAQLSQGYLYLNPTLIASSRLFGEINFDTPLLTRFLVATDKLVTTIASRRNDLVGLIDHLATTTQAIGSQRVALASAIGQLPGFMRQADTTFVDLRTTLDDLTGLVNDSKPVAKKLRPFLAALRPFARDARPTLRSLQRLIQNRRVPNSDLLSLFNTTPPVANIGVGPVNIDGASRPGALPASTQALGTATPELAFARPYGADLTSWFNSFSHSGVYDALGGASRVAPFANPFALISGILTPIPPALRQGALSATLTTGQRNRCPGSAEHPAADGSNPYHPPGFPCDPTQVPPGQ